MGIEEAGHRADEIAEQLGKHRATIYRWLKGIRMRGIRGYVAYFKQAKKGRRVRKTPGYVVQRVLSIRREYRDCCGEKVVYVLAQEGIDLSRSTVYRILKRHLVLRKHHRQPEGAPVQRATGPRQVVQVDTVNLGEVYAYTAIDTFTREAAIVMRPSLQAADGRVALEQLMAVFGRVSLLQTDGGSEFKPSALRACIAGRISIVSRGLTRRTNRLSLKPSTARCAVRSLALSSSGAMNWSWPSSMPMLFSTTITTGAPISHSACSRPLVSLSRICLERMRLLDTPANQAYSVDSLFHSVRKVVWATFGVVIGTSSRP
ncbi:MAG: hypothetical protein HPY64_12495 [Anaerolineae bacterium]|nr:hypothetical protein [Anaerolineae bacterium]